MNKRIRKKRAKRAIAQAAELIALSAMSRQCGHAANSLRLLLEATRTIAYHVSHLRKS